MKEHFCDGIFFIFHPCTFLDTVNSLFYASTQFRCFVSNRKNIKSRSQIFVITRISYNQYIVYIYMLYNPNYVMVHHNIGEI